ncbi:putative membrane protein SirB2 [Pasteurella langaaensis DSM 22999]|uniref:Putative membrane protein SirB2 n=1 Tax=Alitibacter langaaensis DSM 22999 TaxID=1122935 RepID=A0A2U0SMX1_9PAST|nr:SirB2 family protein [Pasteurella langaaensis]PVX32697.1 putative membrane protein SirB2 [Pasteurella langaaensis DSM 22999]
MSNLVSLHVVSAFLSLALLLIRGGFQLLGKDWRAIKLLKILPHLSDTLLLVSGVLMIFVFGLGLAPWLIGKIVLLVIYTIFAAKYFSKKISQPNSLFLVLALLAFVGAMLLGYNH